MELTINNLIKIVIAAAVIIIVILGISMSVKNYVIPYFSGIGFEEPKIDANSQFGKELIQEKNKIGIIKEEGTVGYFVYENKKTKIYFTKNNEIKKEESILGEVSAEVSGFEWFKKKLGVDEKIGNLDKEGKITIEKDIILEGVNYKDILNGAYKYGLEIYKIS